MQSTTLIITKIIGDHPQFQFVPSDFYGWNSQTSTIHYMKPGDPPSLLHELSHALLDHRSYDKDIELLRMEAEAWSKATSLAATYSTHIPDTEIQENIDTYRDWLHRKSICPKCEAIGIQQEAALYYCLSCEARWSVNEARNCSLRRKLKTVA